MTALYIHIPFCLSKCPYCSFSSFTNQSEIYSRYVRAVTRELRLIGSEYLPKQQLQTLFIGGGTPTVLASRDLESILSCCQDVFSFVPEAEISIEANPGTVNLEHLVRLQQAGINRLSLGVQSFNDKELNNLGRAHNSSLAEQAVRLAQEAGLTNVNIDLMYGLPGQTDESWKESLSTAIHLLPTHLSLYQLTLEPGTIFHQQFARNDLLLPDEDTIMKMEQITARTCANNGFQRYEISNYAQTGFKCRHNINYWQNNSYLAAGAGSFGAVNGKRQGHEPDPINYCCLVEQGKSTIVSEEVLDQDASFRETVIMGLRMIDGISCNRLYDRYDIDLKSYYGDTLSDLQTKGLIVLEGDKLRLSEKGLVFANMVMAELV